MFYLITISGSEDSTKFKMLLTDEEAKLIKKVELKSKKNQPVYGAIIEIKKYKKGD